MKVGKVRKKDRRILEPLASLAAIMRLKPVKRTEQAAKTPE